MIDSEHTLFMQEALLEASLAFEEGEVPIGAVIVHEGNIIARAHNKTEALQNPISHAEIHVIEQAAALLHTRRLSDCTLYVTLEPCAMCAGAIVLSRIPNVYIGCVDEKTGAVSSLFQLLNDSRLNHQCQVHIGLLEQESSQILRSFFRNLRDGKMSKTIHSRASNE